MGRKMYCVLMLLCILSLTILMYPDVQKYQTYKKQESAIKSFEDTKERFRKNKELYWQMKAYNEQIYQQGQSGLTDAFSYEQNEFDLSAVGLDTDMIGYMEIPKISLHTPLYIGADNENLAKGVAVLFQTSMPIGTTNSNCVIAGHRGTYNGELFFKELEKLEIGDEIYITNIWETLEYKVSGITVILPDDIDAVKIQDSKDMVTLVTCHPYGQNSHRYVIYATRERIEEVKIPERVITSSSSEKIETESILHERMIGINLLFMLVVNMGYAMGKIRKNRKQKEKSVD